MRTTEQDGQFKRDLKREAKGKHLKTLESDLLGVIADLRADKKLALRFRDHPLSGNWKDHRECHVKPDLLLIYCLPDPPARAARVAFRAWPVGSRPTIRATAASR